VLVVEVLLGDRLVERVQAAVVPQNVSDGEALLA
jgi:hypothetical protein